MIIGIDTGGTNVDASLAGGYGIEGGLPYTNLAVIATMLGYDTSAIREPARYEPPTDEPEIGDVLDRVKDVQSSYWPV